jgi:hypothetical protein
VPSPRPARLEKPLWITTPDRPKATGPELGCSALSTRMDLRRLRLVDRAIADIVKHRRLK